MTARPLTKRQRTRPGDFLEKVAVGVGIIALGASDQFSWAVVRSIMTAFGLMTFAVWLERDRGRER